MKTIKINQFIDNYIENNESKTLLKPLILHLESLFFYEFEKDIQDIYRYMRGKDELNNLTIAIAENLHFRTDRYRDAFMNIMTGFSELLEKKTNPKEDSNYQGFIEGPTVDNLNLLIAEFANKNALKIEILSDYKSDDATRALEYVVTGSDYGISEFKEDIACLIWNQENKTSSKNDDVYMPIEYLSKSKTHIIIYDLEIDFKVDKIQKFIRETQAYAKDFDVNITKIKDSCVDLKNGKVNITFEGPEQKISFFQDFLIDHTKQYNLQPSSNNNMTFKGLKDKLRDSILGVRKNTEKDNSTKNENKIN